MATFQDIRNRQRQGEAARERVLQRVSNPQPVAPQRSAFDAIRNRPIETAPPPRPQPVPGYQGTSIPMQPMGSRTDFKKLGQQIKDDQAASDWLAQQQARRDAQDPSNPTLKAIKDNTIDAAAGFIDRLQVNNPVGRFFNRFGQSAGSAVGVDTQAAGAAPLVSTGNRAADVAADITGSIAGSLTNPSNAGQGLVGAPYRAGQALAQRVTSRPLAQRAIEGATAGAIQGGVISGVRGETDPGELALNVGLGAAAGAAGDVGASLLGRGVSRLFQRRGLPPELAQEVLALPPARERGNVNRATAPNVIIDADTRPVAPLGLPEPAIAPPTIARSARQVNPYRQQFEALIGRARQLETEGRLTPGREDEDLRSLWSQMAGPDAPDLDRLIDLAYPPRQSRVAPGMVQQARQYQQAREVAGAPMPVRSMQDRYRQGAIASVAPPVERLGRAPGAPRAAANRAPQDGVLNADVTPQRPRVDVTPPAPGGMAAADESLGISPFGRSTQYTNPEDTRGYIASRTEREPVNLADAVDRFYTKTVDNLQRLNDLDKTVERLSDRKLSADERAYYLALNSRGSDVTAKHILTERLVNPQGEVIGPALREITEQIPTRQYDNFVDYLIAKHAETRMGRGERVYDQRTNMTPERVRQKVEEYERTYPQFKTYADQLYDWNDRMTQAWLVDTGIISPETAAAWKEANPYWIPNQRKFSQLEKRLGGKSAARRGFANQNNPVRKYSPTGSERPIIDPFESLIEYTDRYVKTARRNEVMQTILRNVERDPESMKGFATILRREKVQPKSADGVEELIDNIDREFDATLRKNDLAKDNVVSTLVDGERVYMRVEDPALLDALSGINPQARNAIVEGSRKLTNAMKVLTTGANPVFGLTRNIFRDIPEAYIFSKTTDNPFRYVWDMLEGFISVFADGAASGISGSRPLTRVTPQSFRHWLDSRAALYKDYKALGGGHSSPAAANRNLLAQSKRQLLPQNRSGFRGAVGRAWGALENLNNALESGPRLGEFKRTRQAGGDTYASRVAGVHAAQEVTTNFKRSGAWVRDADAFVPYLNAAVQGLDKFVRAFKDRPAATAMKAVGAIAAPTIALYALNRDNPAYEQMSNYNKDNFYLIPTGDGSEFIRFPKPRELGVPFGGMVERALRAWADDDPEAFRDFAATARTMFAPPVIGPALEGKSPFRDTIIGPTIELSSNENFTGAPIVPGYLQNLSPRLQYDANTSEVGKWVGDKLNVSPKQVDHLIRGYTGVIGQLGLPAATQGSSVGGTLRKQVTADSAFSTDATRYFYELKDKLDQQYADARATGDVPKDYNDGARRFLGQVANTLGDYTRAIRDVDSSSLSESQKRDRKRRLTQERNDLARQAYERVRDTLR